MMNKPNHFRNCAQATAHVKPNVSRFYNEPGQAEIEQRVKAGTFTLAETFKAAVPGHEASCSASLHCARPDSTHSNVTTDINGVLGLVCMHTMPLIGAFLDTLTHENYSYYIVDVTTLVAKLCEAAAVSWRPLPFPTFALSLFPPSPSLPPPLLMKARGYGARIGDLYVDFACKLKVTFSNYIKVLQDHGEGEERNAAMLAAMREIRLLVNWMHGSSHELSCQVQHMGRYAEGAGRKVGENTEQLWSLLKVSTLCA